MVAECTFAFDEDTHLILSAIRRLRQGSVPLETCTHRKSCNNFHRSKPQLQFARTSPSTFLFLLSSQCQRADHSTVTGINRHREHRSQHLKRTYLSCWSPSRSTCSFQKHQQWEEQALSVVSVAASLSDISIHVNTAFSITASKDFSSFSVTCSSSCRRLAPPPEAMTGL